MAVVTAVVAQNTHGVRSVHVPPARVLRAQLDAVSDDVIVDAVKIGMLGSTAAVAAVERWLHRVRPPIVVLDPVLHSSSGRRLLPTRALRRWDGLLSCVDLLTPNLPELATLQARFGDWHSSLLHANDWLSGALRHADELRVGTGNGPLNHFHRGTSAATEHPRRRD